MGHLEETKKQLHTILQIFYTQSFIRSLLDCTKIFRQLPDQINLNPRASHEIIHVTTEKFVALDRV